MNAPRKGNITIIKLAIISLYHRYLVKITVETRVRDMSLKQWQMRSMSVRETNDWNS
jgi:hypothetical protein